MSPLFLTGIDGPEPTESTAPFANSSNGSVTPLTVAHASATGAPEVSQQVEFTQKLMNLQRLTTLSVGLKGLPLNAGSPSSSEGRVLRLVWRLANPLNLETAVHYPQ